ncbi:MAG: hypothetical protein OEU26_02725 [Candidatus Tectomicrobia bacterium]|nr:hypothetical protein [Candidatus Tectomicrobia bacterium]
MVRAIQQAKDRAGVGRQRRVAAVAVTAVVEQRAFPSLRVARLMGLRRCLWTLGVAEADEVVQWALLPMVADRAGALFSSRFPGP